MAKKIILTSSAPKPIGPYSQAVAFGNQLYVSGQISIDPTTGNIIQGSIEEETQQVMRNLKEVLNAAGMNFDNVVKCTIFLTDMNDFPKVNIVYGEYFTSDPPARETVEVRRLPKDVRVEISCIAIK